MQNILGSTPQKASSFYLVVLLSALTLLTGCDQPGSVGSGLSDSDANLEIRRDTIKVTSTRQFNSFSGNFAHFSAGQFNDPLFGDVTATGYLKPGLLVSTDTLDEDATMKMRLLYNLSNVYGDTLSSQTFDVFAVDEYWRPNNIKLMDDLQLDQSQKVASFTVGEEDSLEVTLDPQWVDNHYRPYLKTDSTSLDSVYKNEEFGLALVPTNSNKIVPFDVGQTRFVIENPEDTLTVSVSQSAYQLTRKNQPAPPEGTAIAHNMLEQVLNFDFDISDIDITGPNIARAELIFYQDHEIMSQTISGAEQRPQAQAARLHFVNPEQAPDNLLPGNPVVQGTYSKKDHAFHFNVTQFLQRGLVNGLVEGQEFYITLPNDGIVRSSLLYVDSASVQPPQLVITYLKNSSN